MPSYNVKAINVNSFNLGEADRVLTIFTPEKGLLKAIAKGARRPGTKMAGRSDILCVNELALSSGRSFEIITQAQSINSNSALRADFARLSYGLFYAELTACFGSGLEGESATYFDFLIESLSSLAEKNSDPLKHCLEFEFALLDFLGYKPELTFCISCRDPLNEYSLSRFVLEQGGIVCSGCYQQHKQLAIREAAKRDFDDYEDRRQNSSEYSRAFHITPLVWKTLILRAEGPGSSFSASKTELPQQVLKAAQNLLQSYIELRAGKHLKSLDLLKQIPV